MTVLIKIESLTKLFPIKRSLSEIILRKEQRCLWAVNNVSFSIHQGNKLGIAGESGCGKTTLGKLLVQLYRPTSGRIFLEDVDISSIKGADVKNYRRQTQLVFQNPYTAINPRFSIYDYIAEPLIIHNIGAEAERSSIVYEMLEKVRLNPPEKFVDKFPHQLSGGERQRAVIARALILKPRFFVADEPASMLDVSIRAGILDLMEEITEEMNLTVLYISHDLSLLSYMCDYIAVMYLGKIVEMGAVSDIVNHPAHPYTRALVAAVPVPDPDFNYQSVRISGNVPSAPLSEFRGCIFNERCPEANAQCRNQSPEMKNLRDGHWVHCILY
jgi:oligopeptide/dipeptide ABC transporter ATP-binding protein